MHTVWSVFACSAIQAGTLSRRQGGVCGAHSVCLSKVVLGLFFAVISSLNGNTSADETGIHKQLRYFETLKMSDFTVRSRKRRSAEDISPTQEISFQAFGRQFDLVLKEGSSVFAPDFHAKTVERNGRMERIQLSEEDFLTGHLREDESVAVDAFFEDGVLCSVIHSHDEIYVTEPSWRHIPHSGNHSVIAYRGSDIRWRVSFPPPPVLQDNTAHDSLASEGGKRERRASETWAKNRCPLRVVADHKFFSIHAFNRTVAAAQIMIWTIQMANRILTTTVWDKTGLTNIGIHIKEMLIFKEPTTGEAFSFNWPNRAPVRLDLLEKSLLSISVFPAVHQYTYHRGSEGTIYPNTGFTSSLGPAGEQLLHLMRTLVTVHGHSWGAPHDGATSHCSREQMTEKDGVSCQGEGDPAGQYLMHPQSVDGHHPNNMMFSPCSKYEISLALRAKAPSCFVDEGTHMWKCGNGIVDEGEMCDAGVRGRFDKKDPCCTSTCRLRDNATCSDFNSDCCLNCQTAPKGFQCAEEIDLICVKASFCERTRLYKVLYGSPERDTRELYSDGSECRRRPTLLHGLLQ
ncbi:hypothetical protein BaRGS_00031329 [Batillaria attramentaria]|uniref:Disintegrin domain-containing protein n=1 Tax=Batillaria attramentaria TaxID=370345 RepID=A0ABD0JR71_9CAEN